MLLTRKMHFSASHRLYNPKFSEEKNREIFGLCANPNGHGHNYEIEVTVEGEPIPETGMIIDLKKLREIIQHEVIDHVDHTHLNIDVPFMKNIIPTAENIVKALWERLTGKIPGGTLYEIKLYETDNNSVIYRG